MTITTVTYLDEAVSGRLVPMIAEVATALDVPMRGVLTYWTDKPALPFCWLYPGESAEERRAVSEVTETYLVYARFVFGYRGDRIDGKWAKALWTFLPSFRRYFREKRDLIYQAGQTKPANLRGVEVGIFSPFGVFDDGTDHIGFEAPITLTFLAGVSPSLGNF